MKTMLPGRADDAQCLIENSINITIPDFITQAFPMLKEAIYVREFASFITLYPDAVYYIFQTTAGQSLILVAIDYPDPIDESQQVKSLSGGFEFEFAYLIKPYANDQRIEVRLPHRLHPSGPARSR